MTDWFQFALAVAIVLATPGPTNTLLLTAGATAGFRAVRLIPAEILGYLTTVFAVGYLIGDWVQSIPSAAMALRVVVATYLLYLAIRLWRTGLQANATQRLITFRDVLVTTMLNPKALIFALGIVPLHAPGSTWYLGAFVLMVVVAGSSWALLGVAVAKGLLNETRTRQVPRFGAMAILGFAGYLVLAPLAA